MNKIEKGATIYGIISFILLIMLIFNNGAIVDIAAKIYTIITLFLMMVVIVSIGPLKRREIMKKHTETFKPTEMKGTIKLEPEDVKLDEDDNCPGCEYAIDLSKRLVNELGPDWAEHWKVTETNLTPHEDFYNIDVILKRRKK